MGQKKNEIKRNVGYCYFCGYVFKDIREKIIHRINVSKNISENNVVILCQKCKYKFSLGGDRIYNRQIPKTILDSYFKDLDKEYRKIILDSMRRQKDKNVE